MPFSNGLTWVWTSAGGISKRWKFSNFLWPIPLGGYVPLWWGEVEKGATKQLKAMQWNEQESTEKWSWSEHAVHCKEKYSKVNAIAFHECLATLELMAFFFSFLLFLTMHSISCCKICLSCMSYVWFTTKCTGSNFIVTILNIADENSYVLQILNTLNLISDC